MKTFLYADPHFSHEGVCRFLREDGTKLRPYSSAKEMDDDMILKYNQKVAPTDKVYFLGDVAINRKGLKVLSQLNGRKILIKGNHDIFKLHDYSEHFDDIRATHVLNGMILTHIPIHSDSLARFGVNIHGHLHSGYVKLPDGSKDPRYFCVSVEHTDFSPIDFEEVKKRIVENGGKLGFKEKL